MTHRLATAFLRFMDELDDLTATLRAAAPPLQAFLIQLLGFLVVCGGLVLAVGGLGLAFMIAIG